MHSRLVNIECATIGCRAIATQEPLCRPADEIPWRDAVCQECGESYARRPSLKAELKPLT